MTSTTWGNIKKFLSNPHVWVTVLLLVIGLLLHYPQQLLGLSTPSVFSFAGLERHAVERIYLLVPIAYASFFVGPVIGFTALAAALAIMLPRVFLLSDFLPDALAETIAIALIGGAEAWWFSHYRSERRERLEALTNLENKNEELRSYTEALERDERRLFTLNKISSTISQSIELSNVLTNAVDSVYDGLKLDAAWIYLLSADGLELNLSAQKGFSIEFAKIKVGNGISGKVVQTGTPDVVEDTADDARVAHSFKEKMTSVVIVPLTAKGKVNGTLGIASKSRRTFSQSDVELLDTIGNQIGVAVENARLYQEQLEISDKLRVSEKRYRDLFENAHDAVWVHDMEGNITAANKATGEMLERKVADLIGLNVREFLAGDSLHLAAQVKQKLMEGQPVEQPYEQQASKKNGGVIILKLTTNVLEENGKVTGFLCIARDVTKEKETQDKLKSAYEQLQVSHQQLEASQEQLIQAEKLSSLGQLSASVAHEVNNPIAGILVYDQLLMKKLKNDTFEKEDGLNILAKMEGELIRIGRLIRRLLDFSRQTESCLGPVNLNNVLDNVLSLVNHAADMQRVKIVREMANDLPAITADADQMNQVFMNLTMNAIQAMPQGGTMTVRSSKENGRVKVEVQDTGVGISKENMRRLYTPFFSTKKEVKGVGLGLAVSHGIIEQHRGKIEVVSEEGKGTTFTVFLNANQT
ncbi:MAG TPA: ATP-binding protein [Dehalococcoidales bacterium]|nr:ATP-binding protein [Dehalococcoidales bacterium]